MTLKIILYLYCLFLCHTTICNYHSKWRDMKFLSSFLLLSCFAVLGHSLPHNWRHSHTSHRTYSSKRWGYNPYLQSNRNRWGHNPYRYHHKMHTKGFAKDSRTIEPSMINSNSRNIEEFTIICDKKLNIYLVLILFFIE